MLNGVKEIHKFQRDSTLKTGILDQSTRNGRKIRILSLMAFLERKEFSLVIIKEILMNWVWIISLRNNINYCFGIDQISGKILSPILEIPTKLGSRSICSERQEMMVHNLTKHSRSLK
jgi:hypothetical protein